MGLGIKRFFRENIIHPFLVAGKQKLFCIGHNKTGTTSVTKAFEEHDFIVGYERSGEMLIDAYANGNFHKIITFCKSAQVFQDAPFSWPHTFKHLEAAYPGSKFILTVRDSAEVWYNSIVKYHGKLWGNGNIPPTAEDLKNTVYRRKGWMWDMVNTVYKTTENDPYNKKQMISVYENHNQSVRDYFENSDRLLEINLKHKDAYKRFCNFIDVEQKGDAFPWVNKTSDIDK